LSDGTYDLVSGEFYVAILDESTTQTQKGTLVLSNAGTRWDYGWVNVSAGVDSSLRGFSGVGVLDGPATVDIATACPPDDSTSFQFTASGDELALVENSSVLHLRRRVP